MKARLLSACILLGAVAAAVALDRLSRSAAFTGLLIAAFLLGAMVEFLELAGRRTPVRGRALLCAFAPLYVLLTGLEARWGLDGAWRDGAVFGLLVALLAAELRGVRPDCFRSVGVGLLGVAYVALAGGCIYRIRLAGGMGPLLLLIGTAKMTDNGALFGGRLWGVTRLAPRLSPAKTVIGLWCGLLCGTAFAVLAGPWLGGGARWSARNLAFGAVVSALAAFGDLAESALKREAGARDSGRLLPGVGGFLDILDSLLLSAPAAWWLLTALRSRPAIVCLFALTMLRRVICLYA